MRGAGQKWTMRATGACFAAHLICSQASADATDGEARRFPQAHIKKAEWQQFLVETKRKPGAFVLDRAGHTGIVVPQERAIYFFTKQSHPAHPAAVRRAIVSYGNESYIHTSGYYAGKVEAFVSWLEEFRQQDRQLQRDLQRRRRAVESLITRSAWQHL
jgi:hypothetical protein